MFESIFCAFFIAHILGDFYFQSQKLSQKKNEKYRYVILHGLIYALPFAICFLCYISWYLIIAAGSLILSHFIIDTIKFFIIKKSKKKRTVYITDQAAHIFLIATAAVLLVFFNVPIEIYPEITDFLLVISKHQENIMRWTGMLLLIYKPANITIKQLISKPQEGIEINQNKAGAYIGTLERIIIVIFFGMGEFAAIGFTLTAKSIARYSKINENKEFGEYYLLGTLLSTIFAILAYYIFI